MTASQLVHDAIHLFLRTEGGDHLPAMPRFEKEVLRTIRSALDGLDLTGTDISPTARDRISKQLAAMAELS